MALIEVPYQTLSSQVVKRIVEDYVLEEGTDYGVYQYDLSEKVAQVMRQLENGYAKIFYDSKKETAYVVKV